MRSLILALIVFPGTLFASSKPLKPLTDGCFADADLKITAIGNLSKGIRIYSNMAEFEITFQKVGCVNPNDAWACDYEQTYWHTNSSQRKPFKAELYPSGYDLELNGTLHVIYPSGRRCRYDIGE